MLSDWLELFYLQTVLPEQNDLIPLLTKTKVKMAEFRLGDRPMAGLQLQVGLLQGDLACFGDG
jgi:hypothetical protein